MFEWLIFGVMPKKLQKNNHILNNNKELRATITPPMKQINENASIYSVLSRRQIQILRLIVEGKTDKEIANILSISFNTVRTHHQKILSRTGQHNIGGLIRFALKTDAADLV